MNLMLNAYDLLFDRHIWLSATSISIREQTHYRSWLKHSSGGAVAYAAEQVPSSLTVLCS